ncbi:unnamed protein product, partial [Ectocarpus sp. 12 AP-2014]
GCRASDGCVIPRASRSPRYKGRPVYGQSRATSITPAIHRPCLFERRNRNTSVLLSFRLHPPIQRKHHTRVVHGTTSQTRQRGTVFGAVLTSKNSSQESGDGCTCAQQT